MSSELVKTNIRLPLSIKNKINEMAKKEQLSINAVIVSLIEKSLNNKNNNENNSSEIIDNKILSIEDKIDFILQSQEKLKEEIRQEIQKEVLEDFKIFANVLSKKIQEILPKNTNYLSIKKPIKFETAKKFAGLNKKPFLQKGDLIAAIDSFRETAELKIYKILEAESYNNIKAVNIKNEQEKITIDLTNEVHYLSLLQIYRKI